jgi:hypothetical protein
MYGLAPILKPTGRLARRPRSAELEGSRFRKRLWQKQWPPMVPLQREPRATKARNARHDETRRACSWNPPVRVRRHGLVVGSAVVDVGVPQKFLRVRTRLLTAPDHLPRCPHWREPVPLGYTPLTGWGLRQDSLASRRLPDTLDGGVIKGLVGTVKTHQARESHKGVEE